VPGNIVLWGAPLSGKTTYVASLVFWQEHREEADRARRLCVLPANRGAADWVSAKARDLVGGKSLPKTGAVERIDFRLYDLPPEKRGFLAAFRPDQSRHVADLTLWDAPGDVFQTAIPDELLRELVTARGLVMIVNPFDAPGGGSWKQSYWDVFDTPLRTLQHAMERAHKRGEEVAFDPKTRRITYPVAVCLSQVDRADDPTRKPGPWLTELLGDANMRLLAGWLANWMPHSFSARGGAPLLGAGTGADADSGPRPWQVIYPIRWILDQSAERAGADA
jgi:hypothetical protein